MEKTNKSLMTSVVSAIVLAVVVAGPAQAMGRDESKKSKTEQAKKKSAPAKNNKKKCNKKKCKNKKKSSVIARTQPKKKVKKKFPSIDQIAAQIYTKMAGTRTKKASKIAKRFNKEEACNNAKDKLPVVLIEEMGGRLSLSTAKRTLSNMVEEVKFDKKTGALKVWPKSLKKEYRTPETARRLSEIKNDLRRAREKAAKEAKKKAAKSSNKNKKKKKNKAVKIDDEAIVDSVITKVLNYRYPLFMEARKTIATKYDSSDDSTSNSSEEETTEDSSSDEETTDRSSSDDSTSNSSEEETTEDSSSDEETTDRSSSEDDDDDAPLPFDRIRKRNYNTH